MAGVVLLAFLAFAPASATSHRAPPTDPPMPDPCTTTPMLPFCR